MCIIFNIFTDVSKKKIKIFSFFNSTPHTSYFFAFKNTPPCNLKKKLLKAIRLYTCNIIISNINIIAPLTFSLFYRPK